MLTPRGHNAFGVVWAVFVGAICIGFSGVGGLIFLPALALVVPFFIWRRWRGRLSGMEIAMLAFMLYLYTLAILSYCPVRY